MHRSAQGSRGDTSGSCHCASENGLSSLTWGRLRERVTPRSARSWAVHFWSSAAPRFECRVSTWGSMPCLRQVSSISVAASAAFSRSATHPAHDAAAEDVEQDIEVEGRPAFGPPEPGDIPGPGLVGARGHQLGLGVAGMTALDCAALAPAGSRPGSGTSCARRTDTGNLHRAASRSTSAGDRSTKRGLASTSRTCARSDAHRARAGVGRGC